MFDTVLEKLGGLLPKNFLLAAFFPVLLFAGANGVMLYLTRPSFAKWVVEYLELNPAKQAYYAFPILIVIAGASYIFSMLNLSLRRILEGEPPFVSLEWKNNLKERFSRGQRIKLQRLEARLKEYKLQTWKMKRQEKKLYESLNQAWRAGITQNGKCTYTEKGEAAQKVASLSDKRARSAVIDEAELSDAVSALSPEIAKCNLNVRNVNDQPDYDNKQSLDAAQTTMRELISYAGNRIEDEYAEYYNQREYHYSRYRIAPTTMGNVAESVRSYASSRYGINLDPFWLRVQKLVQEDTDFYASLQGAKTQLDFVVSLCWLTIIFTVFWLIYLLSVRQSVWLFFVIGVLGPALAFLWYEIAIQNYLAFADVLRTSLDLYRFKTLDLLHVARPKDSDEERQVWGRLNQVIGYGERAKIVYKNDQPVTTPNSAPARPQATPERN